MHRTNSPKSSKPRSTVFLGIECGGTRTSVLAFSEKGEIMAEIQMGGANLRLTSDRKLLPLFRSIRKQTPTPISIAIGMAGARTEADLKRIRQAANKVWKNVPCYATHDLEVALAAAPAANKSSAQVLVVSGTGSCCFGKSSTGKTSKMGGWGHILGDKGSGFEIGLRALKAAVFYYDRDGVWTNLGKRILHATQMNHPEDLIDWVSSVEKAGVARLAIEVFEAAKQRDKIARDILKGAASSLAKDAVDCAKKLATKSEPVQFIFNGSVLLQQATFARQVVKLIREKWVNGKVVTLKRASVWGAVELAQTNARNQSKGVSIPTANRQVCPTTPMCVPESTAISPTEQRNPCSMKLDTMSVDCAVELMLDEDSKIPAAILSEKSKIVWTVKRIAKAFKNGGRLFYAGAGTSGRLGILDASECPPTFRTPPDLVQGIIAGGQRAIYSAVEGTEDDVESGAEAVRFRGISKKDVVIGIAASGRTPFVWGALKEAKQRDATTVLLCFNPNLKFQRKFRPDKIVCPEIGPEILTGSTRLKAGTATKLILNIFTTLAMVQNGKAISNLMVDLNPSNIKLRDRAIRILSELTGSDRVAAETELEKSNWDVKAAFKEITR